ncbi:major facilitator superfamily (MFS) transporter [Pseudomonas aeruginosa VRFPA02]|nr:major facilitator superfamily (MFS) transporter [Pseudomonas aeruginosa VRFPA02]
MNQPSRLATLYLLGFALDLVNIFIASVAYPDIGRSLGASVATLAWIGNTYLLGLTLVIPLSVWLASRLGERRLMLLALAGFASASLGCGLAGSAATLIVWRLCQGLAGGLLIPLGQAMAYRNVPASARAGLTARVMLVALIVPAVAPALGGWLVDSLSWRGIFFASVAPALLVLALAMRWLPRHKHAAQRLDLRVPRSAGRTGGRPLGPAQAATCAGLPSRRSTRLQAARVATEGINQARPCSASGRCSSHCGKSWPRPAAFRASSTPNARETSITGARMRVAECQRPMQKLSATSTMHGG